MLSTLLLKKTLIVYPRQSGKNREQKERERDEIEDITSPTENISTL